MSSVRTGCWARMLHLPPRDDPFTEGGGSGTTVSTVARPVTSVPSKYLMTDPEFGMKYMGWLFFYGIAGTSLQRVGVGGAMVGPAALAEALAENCSPLAEALQHHLPVGLSLGMLGSACCGIQLALNYLAVGCAGFNTVLGNVTPLVHRQSQVSLPSLSPRVTTRATHKRSCSSAT